MLSFVLVQYLIFISLIVYTFLALHDNMYFCACSVADNSDWLQNKSFLPTAALLAQEETSKAPVFTSSSPHHTPIAR